MLKNFITTAIRHLTRHKMFSLLNIFCLVIGITFSMLIGIFVIHEENVNADIKNISNQYVIKSKWKQDNIGLEITTLGPLAKTMKDEYPGLVANYYRFDPVVNIVSVADKHFRTQISVGDTTLVSMYGFKLLYGNPNQAFRNNQSAVVTEDFAKKFFNTTDAIDKVITIQTPSDGMKHDFVITAVLKNMPVNSIANYTSIPYQVYIPMDANQYFQGGDKGDNWANVFMVSMIELKKGITAKDLEKPFAQILEKYQPPFIKGNLKIQLAAMDNYYLKSNNSAVQKMLSTLSLIAGFILLLAIINFININIGTSSYRLKEIGLRKVFGSAKLQLIVQYLTESLVIAIIAATLSLALYELLLPVFNDLLHTTLNHFWQFNLANISFLLLLVIVVGFISGIYPAFILSASNVITAVKGKIDAAKGDLILRKTLLVIQFTLAIIVFISAMNISRQVSYFFNKDLGYKKEQVMIISSLPRQWDSLGIIKMENIKNELTQIPEVKSISLSYDIPDGNGAGYTSAFSGNNANPLSIQMIAADEDFAKAYSLQLKEGIFLKYDNGNYIPGKVVLNETAEKMLGLTAAAGKTIRIGASDGPLLTIAGVVKDFNFESLQKNVQPVIIADVNEPFTRQYRYFSVKLNTSNINTTINSLQDKWKTLFPDTGFEYSFMDDKFQSLYQSELQLKKAATIGTILNLVIVFLGIFGVVAFTLAKRTKEIAVRKVLGADISNIIMLFIKDYALLIFLSNIIAWPLAYIISNHWLENYAYRIKQDIFPFLFVAVFTFAIAVILITVQCFKAAIANPVKSLKAE